MAVDWQPFIPNYSQGLSALDRAFDYRREQERLRREQERKDYAEQQKAQFENEQNHNTAMRTAATEKRDAEKFAIEEAQRRQGVTKNLMLLLGQGRTSEAQATAASSVFRNPSTGDMEGVRLDQEAGAPPPELKRSAPGENEALARFFRGQAGGDPGAIEPPPQAEAQPGAGPTATGGALDDMEEQMLGSAQAQNEAQAQASKRWKMTMPGGATSLYDDKELKNVASRDREEQAQRLEQAAASETNADTRAAFIRQAGLIRAGASNADKAPITNTAAQENSQDFQSGENAKYRMTADQQHQAAMLRGQNAGRGADWREAQGQGRLDIQQEASAQNVAGQVLHDMGYRPEMLANRKFQDMVSRAAQPNAALDAVTAGSFVKMAQGGTGVVSDQDMKQFWDRIGGKPLHGEQFIQDLIDGRIVGPKRDIVIQAAKELAQRAQSNLSGIKDALDYRLRTMGTTTDQQRASIVGTYFPDARQDIPVAKKRIAGGGGRAVSTAPAPAQPAERRVINGHTYVLKSGEWYEE